MANTGAGAPKGNQNAIKGNRWCLAIDEALSLRSKGDQIKELVRLAGVLLDKAAEGDMTALKELGDRLDGKAKQQLAVDLTGKVDIYASINDECI